MRALPRFIEFDGDAGDLAWELFGSDAHVLLGGSPLACTPPPAGAVVDVSLPTMRGANIARFKPRAIIEHLSRALCDPSTHLFAVWGITDGRGFESDNLIELMEGAQERVRAENDNAATVAHYLACHPRMAEVRYPGLKGDPCFKAATSVLAHGFGNAVDYRLDGNSPVRRHIACADGVFDQIEGLERQISG